LRMCIEFTQRLSNLTFLDSDTPLTTHWSSYNCIAAVLSYMIVSVVS